MSDRATSFPPAELRAVAARLLQLAEMAESRSETDTARGRGPSVFRFEREFPTLAALAENEYRSRRFRDDMFEGDLFGEPAWDMLLDLYINRARGRRISVTSLCHASSRPPTTALRWIGELQERNLVWKDSSKFDNRVSYVDLTPVGIELMSRYLRRRMKSLPSSLLMLFDPVLGANR